LILDFPRLIAEAELRRFSLSEPQGPESRPSVINTRRAINLRPSDSKGKYFPRVTRFFQKIRQAQEIRQPQTTIATFTRTWLFSEYKHGAGFARQPKHGGVVRDRNVSRWSPISPICPICPIFSDPPSFRSVRSSPIFSDLLRSSPIFSDLPNIPMSDPPVS
jgi:hypothetical protein